MNIRISPTFRTVALVVAAFMANGAALAEKDDNKGHGKDKKEHNYKSGKSDKHDKSEKHSGREQDEKRFERDNVRVGSYFNDDHRRAARTYYVQQYPQGKRCPPGLAKKNNGCMPPGQAKKYVMGQPLARTVYWYPVPQPVVQVLPQVPYGYRYVRVGNDILLLSPESSIVVDVIAGLLG
jgi:Ni/Co efflux regulator RcnB